MAIFKTRARAIEMLGRQQIAGIPSATNELFKNAHDAYADHVEVDYFRKERVFLLRDDGMGMDKEDFLNRWLVLGTESKVEDTRNRPLTVPEGKNTRPVLGEKGIGRLSIAAIGKQVLILSRAEQNGKLGKLVGVFIHWGLFEIPGLDLEQIEIPVKEFDDVPSRAEVKKLTSTVISSINNLLSTGDLLKNEAEQLLQDVKGFQVSPKKFYDQCPTDLFLSNDTGTHFFISPVDSSLDDVIDVDSDDKNAASKMEKFLIGFTNTMTPGHPKPVIETAFRDHRGEHGYDDLIDRESFFTPDDFQSVDHHFKGSFDKFGQFSGSINIYNEKTIDHKIPWSGNNFKKTLCGPFSIECSYLQGKKSHTVVEPIKWSAIKRKTDRFGGLYIYKDGIRMLPYGDTDYDFIDIEKNRTKSASYYFFSYRRMLGVVNITRVGNPKLIEKAGREGFVENKAYKQLHDILKNFFVQLAGDFFREAEKGGAGSYTEYWENRRRQQERIYKANLTRKKDRTTKKNNFTKALNLFFDRMQNGVFIAKVDELLNKAESRLYSFASLEDHDEAAQKLINEEAVTRTNLENIRSLSRLKSPRGFSPTKEQREDWGEYLDSQSKLELEVFKPAEVKIVQRVNYFREKFSLEVNNRKRIQKAVELVSNDAQALAKAKRQDAQKVASEMTKKVRGLTQDLIERVENSIRDAQTSLTNVQAVDVTDEHIQEEISRLEQPIIRERDYATKTLESVIAQIEGIFWERDDDGQIITNQQISDALEEEVGELKEKVEADAELIQLGLAVNIVHHEFANSVKALRAGLRTLKRKADIDKQLKAAYRNLQLNFAHLDHYLSLLTPFSRRISQDAELIKTEDIYIFMLDVFRGRFQRHSIKLKRTKLFIATEVFAHRSILYPVFANLVDNAIHWLKQKEDEGERIIRLHASRNGAFFVSNNGPEIPIQDNERIFELGFSKKPKGRGMGLTISRDVLSGISYKLQIVEPRPNMNVTFGIIPITGENSND